MAETAVKFVIQKLGDIALNKALELYNLSDQIEPIHLELRLIQCFLRDADSKRKRDTLVNQWVKEIREVAYRIEDALDTFQVEIEENNPKGTGYISNFKRLGKHPVKLAGFSDEITKIRETLKTLYERKNHFGITRDSVSSEDNSWVPFRPSELSDIDVSEVVGFDDEMCEIIGSLCDRSISRRTVLSIVGTGGLGKTTLAQKVYKSAKLEGEFGCRAWLSISQKFSLTNLLRELLYSIDSQMEKREPAVADKDLREEIKRSLSEKRYLITLDDVWSIDVWDRLKITLPDMNNGSRVLITSRSLDVAKAADPETPSITPSPLNEEDSLALLLKKASPHKQPEDFPSDLMEIARQLIEKCGRLPLALTVLGGILSRREPTQSAWKKLEETNDWHNEGGAKCSQVLAMSYKDLPYHLKPCFLYFASFPEDHNISAKHVTRMWIAEGFIPKDGPGTLEDKALNYLEELVQRCLVQVVEKSWDGYCKYCSIHDLLRDLAIHEAKEENFFTVFSKLEVCSQLDATLARRAALQFCTPTEYGTHSNKTRSLLFFGQYISNYRGFRLLRVLTIERVDMSEKIVSYKRWLKGLIHLRYLGFRYCGLLPHGFGCFSFSSLKNLETLEFKKTRVQDGPHDSLWEIPTLMHVISSFPLINHPSKWDHLKHLQTLKWVSLHNIPKEGCNINLRKIRLDLGTDFWKQCVYVEQARDMLIALLKRMEFLVSLSVYSSDYVPFPIGGTSDLPCYETIKRLYLSGKLPAGDVLHFAMFPTNLTKFTLIGSKLEEDPMPILERIQSLMILELEEDSYVGKVLKCSRRRFPNLQKLVLYKLPNLHRWDIREGAMPKLSHLTIAECPNLHTLPDLEKVRLKDLILRAPSKELQERMQGEDLYKIKNIISVRISGQ